MFPIIGPTSFTIGIASFTTPRAFDVLVRSVPKLNDLAVGKMVFAAFLPNKELRRPPLLGGASNDCVPIIDGALIPIIGMLFIIGP